MIGLIGVFWLWI